jgi:hypothetical protein
VKDSHFYGVLRFRGSAKEKDAEENRREELFKTHKASK